VFERAGTTTRLKIPENYFVLYHSDKAEY